MFRRSLPALTAVALIPFAFAACGPDEEDTSPPLNDGPVKRAFENAAIAEGVPESLLLAVGWAATHWVHEVETPDVVDGEEDDGHHMGLFGIMQLGPRGQTNTLTLAAELLDQRVEVVRDELDWNVRGAAAVLRRYADEMYEGLDVESLDLFAWRDVVVMWTGIDDPNFAYAAVEEIYATLRDGVGRELPSGEHLELFPNPGLGSADDSAFGQHVGELKGLAGVKFVKAHSDHYGVGGNKPTHIVIHTMQGSYLGSQSWALKSAAQRKKESGVASQSSAHYYLKSSNGEITQMVSEDDQAYHARGWNAKSVGLEHEGFVNDPTWYTDAMYRASARISCDIGARWNIPLDLNRVVSHQSLDPGRRTDPGPHWDWAYYMSLLKDCSGNSPGGSTSDPTPPVKPADGVLQGLTYTGGNTANRVGGANVRLSNGKTVTSDANGYWKLAVPPGSYTVTVTKEGFKSTSVTRTVASKTQAWASTNLTPAEVVAPTGQLTGVVYDSADATKRVAGATIQVGGKSLTSDAQGRFSVELPTGAQTVNVSATDYVSRTLNTTVTKGQTTTLNVSLVNTRKDANGTIVGLIYEAPTTSKRLPGARVTLTSGSESVSIVADGNGYYEAKNLKAGVWRVTASATNFSAGSTSVSLTANQKPWGSIGLRKLAAGAGDGTLTGVVYESPNTNRRLRDATVTLSSGASVTTDANGVYSVPASGEVSVVASATGFSPRALTRRVPAGQTVWGSIGLVKPTPGSSEGDSKECVPTGVSLPRNPPYDIALLKPVSGANTSLTPTFEFSGVGDSSARYRIVLIKADNMSNPPVEYEAGRADGNNKVTFQLTKKLEPSVYTWSAYAYWSDCGSTDAVTWTNFFPLR